MWRVCRSLGWSLFYILLELILFWTRFGCCQIFIKLRPRLLSAFCWLKSQGQELPFLLRFPVLNMRGFAAQPIWIFCLFTLIMSTYYEKHFLCILNLSQVWCHFKSLRASFFFFLNTKNEYSWFHLTCAALLWSEATEQIEEGNEVSLQKAAGLECRVGL